MSFSLIPKISTPQKPTMYVINSSVHFRKPPIKQFYNSRTPISNTTGNIISKEERSISSTAAQSVPDTRSNTKITFSNNNNNNPIRAKSQTPLVLSH